MRRTIAALALAGATALLPAAMAYAQEDDTASPPTTSELDENLPGDAPDALEDNGDDDSNVGLWGLLGLLGLAGLAGLLRKRHDDGYTTRSAVTNPAPKTARGATGTSGTTDTTYGTGSSSGSADR
jgi:MYXO-CTERM domain-containing protein